MQNVLAMFLAFCKLIFIVCNTCLDSYLKQNKLAMKCTGSGNIRTPIVWQNSKLSTLKKNNLVSKWYLTSDRLFIIWNIILVKVIYSCCTIFGNNNVFTLPIFKVKCISFFTVCFTYHAKFFHIALKSHKLKLKRLFLCYLVY